MSGYTFKTCSLRTSLGCDVSFILVSEAKMCYLHGKIFSLGHTLKLHVLQTATVKFGASLNLDEGKDAEGC